MKIVKILSNFLIIFALSHNLAIANIKEKIIAQVESEIISSYELKNKIKTLLFLSNEEFNQSNVNATQKIAIQSLINIKLKKIEVTNYKVKTSDENWSNYLNTIAKKYNTDKDGLKKLFNQNGIDFEKYIDELKIEFKWQQLVFNLYKDKINLDKKEIEFELNEIIKSRKDVIEYNLAEIEIPKKDNINDKKEIEEIMSQISKNGFENTATKFSIASSALEGGNLGWINSGSLSQKISQILNNMNIGEVSKPLIQSNTILFLKIIDKKTLSMQNKDIIRVRENIINNKKNELLNLFSNNYLSKLKNNAFIQIK